MLYNMVDLLSVAYKNNFAVGSYNVANSEFVEAIITRRKLKMRQLYSDSPQRNQFGR